MTPIYLINMDRSPDRLSHMEKQAKLAGISFSRFPAVVGNAIPPWLAPDFTSKHQLTPGEIGCYASHLCVARDVVHKKLPYVIVLEDDIELDANFMQVAERAIANAPDDADFIHLSSDFKRSVVSVADLDCGRHLVQYTRWPVNSAAYILTNKGAQSWLKPMQRIRPNDMDNRYCWLQGLSVYGVYPAPTRQTNTFKSDVGHDPTVKETRNWSPGFLSCLYGEAWTANKIGLVNYAIARAMNIVNSLRRRIDGKRRVAVIGAKTSFATEPLLRGETVQ